MSAEHVPDVLLLFGAILVPGAGACLATRATEGRLFVTFLGLAFGLGFAIVAALSLVLALLGVLAPVSLGVGWAAIAIAAWTIGVRRGRLAAHARPWRAHVAADPWAAIATAATVLGAAVVRWTIDPLVNLAPTVLRYWADGLELVDTGGIPETTLQWGRVLPTAGSKIVLSAFDAAAATLLGRGPLEPLAALLFVVSVALVVLAIAFLSELGIRRWAPLAAVALFFTPTDLAIDLDKNLAEDWGRMVALAAVLAAALALDVGRRAADGGAADPANAAEHPDRTRNRWALAIAGVLLGVATGTHLVAACVGLAILCSLAAAVAVVERGDAWGRALRGAGAIAGLAVVVGAAVLAVVPGDLGFEGAVDQRTYAALREDLDLPETFDATLFIAMNDLRPPTGLTHPGPAEVARQFAYRLVGANAFDPGPGRAPATWLVVGPTILAALLVLALVLRGPPDLRLVAVASVILAVGLLAIGVLFAVRFDVFALEFFGNRRLFTYATIPFVAVAAAALEGATRWVGRGRVGERGASILACAGVLLGGALLLPIDRLPASVGDRAAQLALLERVGPEVPCEGRVLATHRTLGTFQTVTGHAAVLEGMGPHVRPSVLELAVGEILQAQGFFADPAAGRDYLRARGVDAIVVARGAPPFGFGGYRVAKVPAGRLDGVPFLRRSFENEAGVVYRVVGVGPDTGLPRVAGRPGFRCDRPASPDG